MTGVLDLWRAVDPAARLVSGSVDQLARPVRGVVRTRATPPVLPPLVDGALLIATPAILSGSALDPLLDVLAESSVSPSAVWMTGEEGLEVDVAASSLPVLVGTAGASDVAAAAVRYLDGEAEVLREFTAMIRLSGAEAALADPRPAAPAGVVASRLRRGIAVTVDGALVALHPRPAGRALATRFVAAHAHLLADRSATSPMERRTRDGIWIVERAISAGSSAWMFDDLPPARIDGAALEALAITLRALLRRRAPEPAGARRLPKERPSSGDPMFDTLLAVARANGRIAPAARALGVHRNTVLYRLRRASAELGLDPRRPGDALRLLRDAERPD